MNEEGGADNDSDFIAHLGGRRSNKVRRDLYFTRGFQVSDIFNIYSTFKLQGYSLDIQLSSYKDIGYIFATYSLHIQYIFNLLSKANMQQICREYIRNLKENEMMMTAGTQYVVNMQGIYQKLEREGNNDDGWDSENKANM